MGLSVNAVFAVVAYVAGLVQFLVAFSTDQWVGLDHYVFLGLWSQCQWFGGRIRWTCESAESTDYVQVSQAFGVIALLCYAISFFVMIPYVCVPPLQRARAVLLALVFLVFIAGCMTVMTYIVMGVKGRDALTYEARIKQLSSHFTIGWSYVVAITASVFTFISFAIFIMEFLRVTALEGNGEAIR